MSQRIIDELNLLMSRFDNVIHKELGNTYWFKVGKYKTPNNWYPREIDVVFSVTSGYPGAPPYGFYVPADLKLGETQINGSATNPPPFEGSWLFLSWQPVGWNPRVNVNDGTNLWGWVRSFVSRLKEGTQ